MAPDESFVDDVYDVEELLPTFGGGADLQMSASRAHVMIS